MNSNASARFDLSGRIAWVVGGAGVLGASVSALSPNTVPTLWSGTFAAKKLVHWPLICAPMGSP